MRCLTWAFVVAIGSATVVTGCTGRLPGPFGTRDRPAASVLLSADDLPDGIQTGEDPRVFQGIEPPDPDCSRLLALADGDGLDGRTQAHAVFFQVEPASSVAERVVLMSPAEAVGRIAQVRAAAARCPVLGLGSAGRARRASQTRPIRLRREYRRAPGLGGHTIAVRYADRRERNLRIHFDIVMTTVEGGLLAVAGPTVRDRREHDDLTLLIAGRAVRKARATGLARLTVRPGSGGG